MRNLVLRSDRSNSLDAEELPVQFFWRSLIEAEEVYYVKGASTVCCQGTSSWQINLIDYVSDLAGAQVTSFSYALELDALCITTSAGNLLLLDLSTQTVEEVGLIEGGITAAAWSPEGELLAVITGSALLLMFNKAFDVLAETELLVRPERIVPSRSLPPQEQPGAKISVGCAYISWRGDGKYFATVTSTSFSSDGVLRVWERDGCVLHAVGEKRTGLTGPVAWQPNGRHIYAAQAVGGQQRIALFERNGLGHGGFDTNANGRICNLAWSSDSELLAVHITSSPTQGSTCACQSAQTWLRSNWHWYLKQELRFPGCPGLQLHWSEEGPNTLNICTADGTLRTLEIGTATAVSALGTAAVVQGDQLLLTPLRHCVVPPPLSAVTACFPAPVQCLAFLNDAPSEVVIAALADSSLALLRSIEADLWEETLEDLLDAQHSGPANGHAEPAGHTLTAAPIRLGGLESLSAGLTIRCMAWASPSTVLAVAAELPSVEAPEATDILLEIQMGMEALAYGTGPCTATCSGKQPGYKVLQVIGIPGGGCLVQTASGGMLKYTVDGTLSKVEGFPKPCLCIIAVAQTTLAAGLPPAVGLTAQGEIYYGLTLVASNATSMALRRGTLFSPDYLLYTTKDSFLHTRPLAELLSIKLSDQSEADQTRLPQPVGIGEGKGDNHYRDMHAAMLGHGAAVPRGNILRARAVEQGSVIITAPPDGVAVVLQLPRGNLETIYPRSLVLPAVAAAVKSERFEEAWQLATVHRVDLNLLVDYGWPRFIQTAAEFVRQVPDDQDLVDLLSALQEDSVTAEGGLYAGLPPANPSSPEEHVPDSEGSGKVAKVCRALREAMQAGDPELYLKPILTSYAVQDQIEAALSMLKDAKEAQLAREASNMQASTSGLEDSVRMGQGALGRHRRGQSRSAPSAEDALKHLLLTIDVEHLYRTALGMYELELAYMVVAHSQRDPGEYLLELQQFAAHPEGPLRHYAINMHLKRVSAALRNLVDAGEQNFSQALQLARREGKLRELLSLVGAEPEDASKRRQVLEQYGEWLSEKHMQEDAAVAFMAAGNLPAALAEYKEGNQWRMALALAGRLGYTSEQMRELAETFIETLSESGRLAEAATIAIEHLSDADSAVALLAQAREWRNALHAAALFNRQDLVETTIAPAAAEAASNMLEEYKDTEERIVKYDTRLREVRSRKAAMSAALVGRDEGDSQTCGFDDTASEGGSSIVSGLSVYTQASTGGVSTAVSTGRVPSTVGGRWPQRQRKKGKKGVKIRQGSPEEEAALVAHILSLAPTHKQCTETGQLAELLILLQHEADAAKLQALLSAVITVQRTAAKYAQQGVSTEKVSSADKQAAEVASTPQQVDWKWDILRPI